jgi:TetR/AcrR family fatty acid metabolism transcriptional regulator
MLARLHLETLAAHRNLAIVMQTEVRQSARFIAEFSHQHLVDYLNLVREVIRNGQAQGIFRADVSDRIVAHCMFGALDEMVSSWVFTGRPFDPDKTASAVLNVILSGIETNNTHA